MMARRSLRTRRALLLLSALLVFNTLLLVKLIPGPHGIPSAHLTQCDTELSTSSNAEISQNQTLRSRGNDKNEWLDPMYLLMPDEKVNALPDYDEEDPWKKQKILVARKGFRLFCDMRSPTERMPTDFHFKPREGKTAEDIRLDYGWSNTLAKLGVADSDIITKLSEALDDLKLSTDPKEWIGSDMYHKDSSRGPNGRQGNYRVTKGVYDSLFDLANGGLIAASTYGPKRKAEKLGLEIPPDRLVPFRKWSDVVWVGREEASAKYKETKAGGGKAIKNLEHVFRYKITTNDGDTENVLKMVTGQEGPKDVGLWPGVSYPVAEPQGLAVLGTAHGAGVAWMLSQHKEAMGVRAIDRINVFNCDAKQPDWCIYMHISDVTAGS